MQDKKLWKAFSLYIRLRDADEEGICKCITCPRRAHWRQMDCGHGIGRQHMATKYNERNNHAQCKKCNGFEGGMREQYKEAINKKYGAHTWDLLELAARQPKKYSLSEINLLEKFFTQEYQKILKAKNLVL